MTNRYPEAAHWFDVAVETGNELALRERIYDELLSGNIAIGRQSVPRISSRVALEKMSADGDTFSVVLLIAMTELGVSKPPSEAEASAYLAAVIGGRDIDGVLMLGLLVDGNFRSSQFAERLKAYLLDCASVSDKCKVALGDIYRLGLFDSPPNLSSALDEYRGISSQELQASAALRIAEAYDAAGRPKHALPYYKKAATLGDVVGCRKWGELLIEQGDIKGGESFLKIAAEHNDARAEFAIGSLMLTDQTSAASRTDAVNFLWRSKIHGSELAAETLARLGESER